ncbi:MAG: LysR family transcriptional regulator [Maricaulaceae bacterium]
MDRIDAMRLFLAVVDQGGFTAAARRENTSPAQVSKRVAALEDQLGARLLQRTTRTVSLTEAGAAYAERARELLQSFDALEDAVRAEQGEAVGLLKVTAPATFGRLHLVEPVIAFMARHPGLEVRLDVSDRMVDLVEEGVDVAVRIGDLPDSSLIARKLAPVRLCVAAAPDFVARQGGVETIDALERSPCILDYNLPNPRRWSFRSSDGQDVDARVEGRLRVNSGEAAGEAAAAGLGVAMGPTFILAPYLKDGRLVQVMTRYQPAQRAVWALFPQSRYLARRVRLFVDFLAEQFSGEPSWEP